MTVSILSDGEPQAILLKHPQLLVRTHLQDPAADVAVTRLALNAKLGVVVGLAVRNTIPARGNPHRKRKSGGPGGVTWKFRDL